MMEMSEIKSIEALEQSIRDNLPSYEFLTQHFHIEGVYVRTLFIPTGVILVGKVHKYECINIVAMGEIAISSNEGRKLLKAGDVFVSGPGIKRAGFALKDTLFVTVHRTDLVDLNEIEDELVCDTYDEYVKLLEVIL